MFGFGRKKRGSGDVGSVAYSPHSPKSFGLGIDVPEPETEVQGGENTAALSSVGTSRRNQGAEATYYQAFTGPLLRENRAWLIVFVLTVTVVFQGIAIYRMLPLKERIPYVMEVDKITGRVEIAEKVLTKLNVSQANVDYALRLWVSRAQALNANTLNDGLPKAMAWTRGDAVKQFDDLVDRAKPAETLAKHPGIIRDVDHQTIDYINDGKVALVRYTLIERMNGVEVSRTPKMLTATVALIKPKPDSKEERENPIGLTITQFNFSTEGGNK